MVQFDDNLWYRGVVQKLVDLGPDQMLYEVFFIDYGNTGSLNSSMYVHKIVLSFLN